MDPVPDTGTRCYLILKEYEGGNHFFRLILLMRGNLAALTACNS